MSKSQETPDDSEIWNKFKSGDRQAFDRLYQSFAKSLLVYANKFTIDRQLAEDCLQELFIDLWRTRTRLATPKSVKYYLMWSYRRRIMAELNQRQKHLFVEDPSKVISPKRLKFSVEILHQKDDQKNNQLRNAIESLSSLQREVIYLRFYNGLSISEIASVIDVSKKSVYNAMAKAVVALRKSFTLK